MPLSLPAALALAFLSAGPPPDAQSVLTANNQFAFDLYGRLRQAEGNLFFSPYSIDKALAMVYAGARGETAAELARVLHFDLDPEPQARAFAAARQLLNTNKGDPLPWRKGVRLRLAAALWGQKDYPFRRDYLDLLRDSFGAAPHTADFLHAPGPARTAINSWVEQQTAGKIKDLFAPEAIDTNTRLTLVSAIHFKGDWARPFEKSATGPEPFVTPSGRKLPVPMMSQTDTFGYFEDAELQVLQMPYAGGEWAMVVVLPRKSGGLADLEKALTAEKLAGWVGQFAEREVKVFLPKIKLESAFSLKETLGAMGMPRAFSGAADFRGMSDGGEGLYLSAVVHKAFVEVNEEGTEAAAATGAVVGALSLPRQGPPVFRADHPFVFAIRDVRTGTLLFLGRVVQP
jgi:serpin B